MKCPGQDLGRKNPADVVYDISCYNCGKPVEFFLMTCIGHALIAKQELKKMTLIC